MADILNADLGSSWRLIPGKTAYWYAVEGGYTGTEEEFMAMMAGIQAAEGNSESYALMAEGYALGSQNGTKAGTGSRYYQNNAEYFKDIAAGAAQTAAETATATETARAGAETAQSKAETAKTAAETARAGAEEAQAKTEAAQTAAEAATADAKKSQTEAANSALSAESAKNTVQQIADTLVGEESWVYPFYEDGILYMVTADNFTGAEFSMSAEGILEVNIDG